MFACPGLIFYTVCSVPWLNGNLALAEKCSGPLRFRLRQVLLYFPNPNLKFHIFPPFSTLFFVKALLTRCFFSLDVWWLFSMTHMHYAEVLQANAPSWTEHILTRANKFSPMNQSTNQRSCQVAAQIKDAILGRLALRNQARMIQRPEQRLARLYYTVAVDTCILTAPLWSCNCSRATYEKLLRRNGKYLTTK